MTEIEALKQKVADLEAKQQGAEYALSQLAIVLCAHSKINISKAASHLDELMQAASASFEHQNENFTAPMQNLISLLKTAGEVIDKAVCKSPSDAS